MQDSDFKTCPFCKESIRVSAVKCRFCGEWLEQPLPPIQPTIDRASTTPSGIIIVRPIHRLVRWMNMLFMLIFSIAFFVLFYEVNSDHKTFGFIIVYILSSAVLFSPLLLGFLAASNPSNQKRRDLGKWANCVANVPAMLCFLQSTALVTANGRFDGGAASFLFFGVLLGIPALINTMAFWKRHSPHQNESPPNQAPQAPTAAEHLSSPVGDNIPASEPPPVTNYALLDDTQLGELTFRDLEEQHDRYPSQDLWEHEFLKRKNPATPLTLEALEKLWVSSNRLGRMSPSDRENARTGKTSNWPASMISDWEQGIKNIPIPQNKRAANTLILLGVVTIAAAVALLVVSAIVAEQTNRYDNLMGLSFLMELGVVLTGIAMLIKGSWFYFASTRLCIGMLKFRDVYKTSPWWKKFLSGVSVLLSAAVLLMFTRKFVTDNYMILQAIAGIGSIMLACVAIAMMWEGIKGAFLKKI